MMGARRHRRESAGSVPKPWSTEELIRCGAIGTNRATQLNLKGQVHPLFRTWMVPGDRDDRDRTALVLELHQPLLLASRIIETVGLSWLAEFCLTDIFGDTYPGRDNRQGDPDDRTPDAIIRCCSRPGTGTAGESLDDRFALAAAELRLIAPAFIHWELDPDMFKRRGWVGYTCRHPRRDLDIDQIDQPEIIAKSDQRATAAGTRKMTVLVMQEYAVRLAELRRQGRRKGEELLLTSFMASVTLLHELGHVMYWRDVRAKNRKMLEPYFGSDLEMELGDSFVAHIFGGWVPVPITDETTFRRSPTFEHGLAWRQHLNWEHHKSRPRYRAHYSIPVKYIEDLFNQKKWDVCRCPEDLVRPSALSARSAARVGLDVDAALTRAGLHATAALPDFQCHESGDTTWKRRPGADFRLAGYGGIVLSKGKPFRRPKHVTEW